MNSEARTKDLELGYRFVNWCNFTIFLLASIGLVIAQASSDSPYSIEVLALIIIAFCLIWFMTLYANRNDQLLVLIVAISIYIFFYVRILTYAFLWESVSIPFPNVRLNAADLNETVPRILLFSLLFLIGLVIGESKNTKKPEGRGFPVKAVHGLAWTYLLAAFAITWLIYGDQSQSSFVVDIQKSRNLALWLTLVEVLSSTDLGMFVICFISLRSIARGEGSTTLWLGSASAAIFLYVGASSSFGSTGSGLRTAMLVVPIFLIYRAYNSRVLIAAIAMVTIAMLINVAMLKFAFETRTVASSSRPEISTNLSSDQRKSKFSPGWERSIQLIGDRLGVLDFPVVVMSREPDAACFNRYHNVDHIAKNVANFLLPGIPYQENYLDTSNTLPLCYGNTPELDPKYYHSQPWTLIGLSYRWWPDWYFLVAIITGVTLGWIFRILTTSIFTETFVNAYFAAIGPTLILFMMGFDHTIKTIISVTIPLVFFLVLTIVLQLKKGKLFLRTSNAKYSL